MKDYDIVLVDDDYVVLFINAIFMNNYCVYKRMDGNEDFFEKISPSNKIFTTLEQAKEFITDYKKDNNK